MEILKVNGLKSLRANLGILSSTEDTEEGSGNTDKSDQRKDSLMGRDIVLPSRPAFRQRLSKPELGRKKSLREQRKCFPRLRDFVCVCVCVLVSQSRPTLWNPMNCGSPGPSVHGILQARILEWVAIPFSRGCSQPRDWTQVSCIAGGFFTHQESPERETNSLLRKLKLTLAGVELLSGRNLYRLFWRQN